MVELQLEKFSPLPVTQIVWTMHVVGTHTAPAKGDGRAGKLADGGRGHRRAQRGGGISRPAGKEGFLADRLETPMLDQLAAMAPTEDGAWLFPLSLGGQNAALVAWWFGGVLRNLSFVTLPPAGDRAKELKDQLAHLAWSGELEGWLTAPPKWHLVADPVNATEWENVLRAALNEPVSVSAPPAAGGTRGGARRNARRRRASRNLLPAEFPTRYHQQFVDRLWLRGLLTRAWRMRFCWRFIFARSAVLGLQHAQSGDSRWRPRRQLHECAPAQGALQRAQGAAAVEIRGAGLLADGGGGAAAGNRAAAVQFCRRPVAVA